MEGIGSLSMSGFILSWEHPRAKQELGKRHKFSGSPGGLSPPLGQPLGGAKRVTETSSSAPSSRHQEPKHRASEEEGLKVEASSTV
jgi:hypothetical protein